MEMKKIACVVFVAAASMSAVMAQSPEASPAPAPASDAIAALPALGSLVGASIMSFFALYTH